MSLVRSQAGMWGWLDRPAFYTHRAALFIKAVHMKKLPFECVGASSGSFDTLITFSYMMALYLITIKLVDYLVLIRNFLTIIFNVNMFPFIIF